MSDTLEILQPRNIFAPTFRKFLLERMNGTRTKLVRCYSEIEKGENILFIIDPVLPEPEIYFRIGAAWAMEKNKI